MNYPTTDSTDARFPCAFFGFWDYVSALDPGHKSAFQSELGARAIADRALGVDCVAHARMFFNSPDLGLDRANPGSFSLVPAEEMTEDLRRDYSRMSGMIIGDPPEFDEVMASIAALE